MVFVRGNICILDDKKFLEKALLTHSSRVLALNSYDFATRIRGTIPLHHCRALAMLFFVQSVTFIGKKMSQNGAKFSSMTKVYYSITRGSVFKFFNLSDGFSIHQNAPKYILESNWTIFSHYKLVSTNGSSTHGSFEINFLLHYTFFKFLLNGFDNFLLSTVLHALKIFIEINVHMER